MIGLNTRATSKMEECHFWADVILRQPRFRASRASLGKKSRGLRVVIISGHSVGRYVLELFACETNLKKKRMCKVSHKRDYS